MSVRLKIRSLSFLALTALAACGGAPTRFYTLQATEPAQLTLGAGAPPSFRVDVVHIPPGLDRTELVREAPSGEVTVSDNDHWVAPLNELMRRTLTEDLAARLPKGVVIYPDTPKPPHSLGLVVDILALSHTNGNVVLDADWTVTGVETPSTPGGSQTATPRRGHFSTPEASSGVRGNGAEISALLGALADRIAKDLTAG